MQKDDRLRCGGNIWTRQGKSAKTENSTRKDYQVQICTDKTRSGRGWICKSKSKMVSKRISGSIFAEFGECSPTISKEGMNLILTLIAMNKWRLNVMDVEGASLQGEVMERPHGELWAELPPGGIPGVEDGSRIRLRKSV